MNESVDLKNDLPDKSSGQISESEMTSKSSVRYSIISVTVVTLSFVAGLAYWLANPHPQHSFSNIGMACMDIAFSPDNKYLAVAGRESYWNGVRRTDVYQIDDQKLLHSVEGGGGKCGWNRDGTLFAGGGEKDGTTIELWETKNWTPVDTLKHIPNREWFDFYLWSGLVFDRRDNLFLCQHALLLDSSPPEAANQVSAWWNGPSGRNIEADAVAETYDRFNFCHSAVSLNDKQTRVVVCYQDFHEQTKERCEVWSIRFDSNGQRTEKKEYLIPEGGGCRPCLSGDGRYLALTGKGMFRVFRLADEGAELISTRNDGHKEVASVFDLRKLIDASADGRFFAYIREVQNFRDSGKPIVVRAQTGEPVYDLNKETWTIALSPDGQFLATHSPKENSVKIYEIPQTQPQPEIDPL